MIINRQKQENEELGSAVDLALKNIICFLLGVLLFAIVEAQASHKCIDQSDATNCLAVKGTVP